MYVSNIGRSLGSTAVAPLPPFSRRAPGWRSACGDVRQGASNGLLVDCLKAAHYDGPLRGLGLAVSQSQLSRLSAVYQRARHPNLLTSHLGDDLPSVLNLPKGAIAPMPTFVQQTIQTPPPIPTVSAATLLAAANLPGAPTVVRQAASQYAAGAGSPTALGDFLSKEIIAGSGVTYWWVAGGMGVVILLAILKGGRR